MREIKFRAWDTDQKLILEMPLETNFGLSRFFGFLSNDDVVMQYTGLKDVHGKEIYEGDIVKFSYGIPGRQVIAPIEFIDGAFYAITKGHNPEKCLVSELYEHIGEFEIIGNVYENPELIGADK